MQKSLILKLVVIGGLAMFLLMMIGTIDGIIYERKSFRNEVIEDIAQSSTGAQTITGFVMVAPYKERVQTKVEVYKRGKKQTIYKEELIQRYKYFLPESLHIEGNITTEELYRGIYKVPVYLAELRMKGHFDIPKFLGIEEHVENYIWEEPYIALGVKDIRGISGAVDLKINEQSIQMLPGTKTALMSQGIHASIEADVQKEQKVDFQMSLDVRGMKRLSFIPTGAETQVHLSSPWQHPSFEGRFLPKTREVSEHGFKAIWETSFFSNNLPEHMERCVSREGCGSFHDATFGVWLHPGVDVYLQAERSIKYALLFVGLTFLIFFLFEVLKSLRIHPIQYGFVGVALALFYLLLISLSEHIAFVTSYIIASASCACLLTFYVSYVLRSAKRGLVFGIALAGLYGALFVLIRSEDHSLLMGSTLIFAILTFVMVLTRRVNWYSVGEGMKGKVLAKTMKEKKERDDNDEKTEK